MVKQKLYVTFNDFSGGLNNKKAANLLANNEVAESQNFFLGQGFAEKRYGYVPYWNMSTSYLYEFFKSDYTSEFLAVSGTNLYKDNGSAFTSITMANSLNTNAIKMITYKDRNMSDTVLIADGGKLKTYDGTKVQEVTPHVLTTTPPEATDPGLNDLANLTNFRTFALKGERLFACAHPTNLNRLSFCHIDPKLGYGVYDYFPATHFIDISVDDNDPIINLKVFRDKLIIFCKRSIWLLEGDGRTLDDYTITKLNAPTGCISPGSVVDVGDSIFYLSDTHIYDLTANRQGYGNIYTDVISMNIEKTLDSISLSDKALANGVFFKNKYYLSFPDGTTIVYDNLLQNWTVFANIKATSFLSRNGVLYFAGQKLYKFDETVFSDDGAPIVARLKLKNTDLEHPVNNKQFRKMWVVARQYEAPSSNFNIRATIDYVEVDIDDISTDQSFVWGESNWGNLWGFKDIVENMVKLSKTGKHFQLILINDTVDQPFTFYGVTYEYKIRKAKK